MGLLERERDHRRGEEGRVAQNKPKQQQVTCATTRHTTYMEALDVFPTDPSKSVFEEEDRMKICASEYKSHQLPTLQATPGTNSTERRSTSKL